MWEIKIRPTRNGKGYNLDVVAAPEVRPQVEQLVDDLGELLTEVRAQRKRQARK